MKHSHVLSAVVVAAGNSTRFNRSSHLTRSKALVSWNGDPLIIHTVKALFQLPLSYLALVIRPSDEAMIVEAVRSTSLYSKIQVVYGGARRQDSVRAGLFSLPPTERVLIHDGARPFVSTTFLNDLEHRSRQFDALIPVLPIVETIKEIDSKGNVVCTHDRDKLVRVQTPQFFSYALLKEAHQALENSALDFTDDALMFEHLGWPVHTMEGCLENIKVTVPSDLRGRIHA